MGMPAKSSINWAGLMTSAPFSAANAQPRCRDRPHRSVGMATWYIPFRMNFQIRFTSAALTPEAG